MDGQRYTGGIRVVAGLGNPGRRYISTPHNVGFMVVDALAAAERVKLRRSYRTNSRAAQIHLSGRNLFLVEPQTYMNRSGVSLNALLRKKGLPASALLVVVDDVNLEKGRLRIRSGGSSGGHRGLDSVIRELGTKDFVRLRIGVGGGNVKGDITDYVIKPFTGKKKEELEKMAEHATEVVRHIIDSGVESAMNEYNGAMALVKGSDNGDSNNE